MLFQLVIDGYKLLKFLESQSEYNFLMNLEAIKALRLHT